MCSPEKFEPFKFDARMIDLKIKIQPCECGDSLQIRKNSWICGIPNEAQTAAGNWFDLRGAGGAGEKMVQALYKPLSNK